MKYFLELHAAENWRSRSTLLKSQFTVFCLRRLPKWEFNVVVRGEIEVQDHLDILQIVGATKIHRFDALPERFGFGLAVQPDTAFSKIFSRDTILHQDSHSPTLPLSRTGCK